MVLEGSSPAARALALVVAGVADEGWFLEDAAFFAAGFFVEAVVVARFRLGAYMVPLYLAYSHSHILERSLPLQDQYNQLVELDASQ